jgi:hypothetical protein
MLEVIIGGGLFLLFFYMVCVDGAEKPDSESNIHCINITLEKALLAYQRKEYQDALGLYDFAIEKGAKCYSERGCCLDALGWNLDAIADYNKAIQEDSNDANLYYLRANAKFNAGDPSALNDYQKAIVFSEDESEASQFYNAGARAMGYESATSLYKFQLLLAQNESATRRQIKADKARRRRY